MFSDNKNKNKNKRNSNIDDQTMVFPDVVVTAIISTIESISDIDKLHEMKKTVNNNEKQMLYEIEVSKQQAIKVTAILNTHIDQQERVIKSIN